MTRDEPISALPRGLAFSHSTDKLYLARRANQQIRLWLRQEGQVSCFDTDIDNLRRWSEAQSLTTMVESQLAVTKPQQFAGFRLDRPLLMGILNVTPNSFSDGGLFLDAERAIAHGRALAAAGADIIDVGGESTRPGAEPVPLAQEIDRIVPVVAALAADGLTISIDSRHAEVMRAALSVGAHIINDVTALTFDPESLDVAAASDAAVILMHSSGDPQTMQIKPHYDHALLDIYDWLAQRLAVCRAAGIGSDRLCIDPGIGFGKSVVHNCQILRDLDLYHGLSVALTLGVSRKSFIGALSRGESPDHRLAGSVAAALAGLQHGAQILRVHDIAETAQAVAVWRATQS